MAIKAYTGIMGSGKTYEVVSVVILNALSYGRRVVSNIAGLDFEKFKEILLADGQKEESIGELVSVPHEKVLEPLFWRTDNDQKEGVEAFIQPGDVVVLDEVWRFWDGFSPRMEGDDGKVKRRPDRVMNFIRMHRQFPHPETGATCEMVVICQDVNDLHRQMKGVLEEIYVMTKLTMVGQENRYRVDVHSKKIRRTPLRSFFREYEEKYFPLYKSHSQRQEGAAEAREINIDQRGNLLSSRAIRLGIPIGLAIIGLCAWKIWGFFHPKTEPVAEAKAEAQATPGKPAAAPKPAAPEVSDSWRVVGHYTAGGSMRVLLTDGVRLRQLVDPESYRITSLGISVKLPEGGFATAYSGGQSSGLIPGPRGQK